MEYLGVNVYSWDGGHQDRLLVECLAPAVQWFKRQGRVHRFWFNRFDARGPHVFLVLGVSGNHWADVSQRLSECIERFLTIHPSKEVFDTERLRRRHNELAGKALCKADRYAGLAANNSYCLFPHGAEAYPFGLSAGLPNADELWQLLDDLSFWVIRHLPVDGGRSATRSCFRWLLGLDSVLRAASWDAEGYWRYHVTTLINGLEEALAEDEQSVLAGLPDLVGRRNAEVFHALLNEERHPQENWLHSRRLLMIAMGSTPVGEYTLLREIVHTTLQQFGVGVIAQIPLILFFWQRSLGPHTKEQK